MLLFLPLRAVLNGVDKVRHKWIKIPANFKKKRPEKLDIFLKKFTTCFEPRSKPTLYVEFRNFNPDPIRS